MSNDQAISQSPGQGGINKPVSDCSAPAVESMILTVRGQKVMLDRDLATLYGVSTSRLNEAVKRNQRRFPCDFQLHLTHTEVADLISQNAMSSVSHGGHRKQPWAFTEHGALMAANILHSDRAIQMSVFVVRAFVKMREHLMDRAEFGRRLAEIENILLSHDAALQELYEKIRPLLLMPLDLPREPIGFHVREPRVAYASRPRGGLDG